jgi:hypothetical protein
LAKIPGFDVGPCSNVTPEIGRVAHDAINAKDKKKEESATKKLNLQLIRCIKVHQGYLPMPLREWEGLHSRRFTCWEDPILLCSKNWTWSTTIN